MGEQRLERKLAAILVADVAGYSRLSGADEEGTVARLRVLRRELFLPKIAEHRGRVVKTSGDGILIEFASVVDAVRLAIEVQRLLAAQNADVAADRRIELRIGINLGDVVVEEDGDLMGDGVNVASRLEALAEPGCICLSRAAYDQIRGKIDIAVRDLGEQYLKNIAEPIRVYAAAPAAALPSSTTSAAVRRAATAWGPPARRGLAHTPAIWAATTVVVLILAAAGWFGWRSFAPSNLSPAGHLSIVVLPFANLSNDPSQDYFADGITENLTTDLSRIRDSFVIARNTAFTYKGKSIEIKQIGRELGVRYVLEGSVQRDQNRVRVNVQLINAETGSHLWADRFEDDLADLFKLQDEVVTRLANSLRVELVNAESRTRPQNPDVIDLTMRGWARAYRPLGASKENWIAARDLFQQALKLDPENADALGGAAFVEMVIFSQDWAEPGVDYETGVIPPADRAIASNAGNGMAYFAKGVFLFLTKRPAEAITTAQAGLERYPNLAPLYFVLGGAHVCFGKYEQVKAYIEQAMKLSPRDPYTGLYRMQLGGAEMGLGHYDAAIELEHKSIEAGFANYIPHIMLAAAYALADRKEEATAALAEAKRINPSVTSMKWVIAHTCNESRLYEGLRKAGLPEE